MNSFPPLLRLIAPSLIAASLAFADPKPLPRATPESQGIPSSALLGFLDAAQSRVEGLHSLMLLRNGRVVAEGWWTPYRPESPHSLFSLSKSFTSTAVGIAAHEGRLSINDTVLSFFPEMGPEEPSAQLKGMRVRDLLAMSTGHHSEVALNAETNWTRAFLAHPVAHKPGTFFLYNTPATYMLSAIVQKTTGETVLDYLRPRLFEPLGITNPQWGKSPEGVTLGGYGLSIRTEDIARFGQLYLQKGNWEGRQLVPQSWVEAATARQTSNGSSPDSDWDQGYGYQFWRCRHGAYRGDGAFGQYCIVIPDQNAVVAITSGVKDMQSVMNLVWEHLLPAMRPSPLPANEPEHKQLLERLAALQLPTQSGQADSPAFHQWSGKRYLFPANDRKLEALSVEKAADGNLTLNTLLDGREQRLACGYQRWHPGRLQIAPQPEQAVSASAAWIDDHTLSAVVCFTETPFALTLRLQFKDEELVCDAEYNVGFGSTRQPQLIGRLP